MSNEICWFCISSFFIVDEERKQQLKRIRASDIYSDDEDSDNDGLDIDGQKTGHSDLKRLDIKTCHSDNSDAESGLSRRSSSDSFCDEDVE